MCAYQLQCFTVGMVSSSNLAPGENESSWFCFCLFFYFLLFDMVVASSLLALALNLL